MPKNTRTRDAKQLHSDRLKRIRPFVNFNYDLRKPLTKAAKRKIKEYYDEVSALTNRPYQVYRPRRADHLKEAQEFAQHEKALPGLKVAFIPTDGENKLKITFTEKGISAKSENVDTTRIRLSVSGLLRDPEAHVNERIKTYPQKSFSIIAGRYEIPASFTRETIGKGVARYVTKYNNPDANNYFGNWLKGVTAYSFHNQSSLQEYLAAKQKNIRKLKRERRNANRKAKRTRDNRG